MMGAVVSAAYVQRGSNVVSMASVSLGAPPIVL